MKCCWNVGKPEMFSSASPTRKVPVLLESANPEQGLSEGQNNVPGNLIYTLETQWVSPNAPSPCESPSGGNVAHDKGLRTGRRGLMLNITTSLARWDSQILPRFVSPRQAWATQMQMHLNLQSRLDPWTSHGIKMHPFTLSPFQCRWLIRKWGVQTNTDYWIHRQVIMQSG